MPEWHKTVCGPGGMTELEIRDRHLSARLARERLTSDEVRVCTGAFAAAQDDIEHVC